MKNQLIETVDHYVVAGKRNFSDLDQDQKRDIVALALCDDSFDQFDLMMCSQTKASEQRETVNELLSQAILNKKSNYRQVIDTMADNIIDCYEEQFEKLFDKVWMDHLDFFSDSHVFIKQDPNTNHIHYAIS